MFETGFWIGLCLIKQVTKENITPQNIFLKNIFWYNIINFLCCNIITKYISVIRYISEKNLQSISIVSAKVYLKVLYCSLID